MKRQETTAQRERRIEMGRAYYWRNRERNIAQSRAWALANPDKVAANNARYRARAGAKEAIRDYNRARLLRVLYGLTEEQYAAMVQRQGGVCAICSGVNDAGRPLAVDHDHATGAVRGLLCGKCNKAIGLLGDSAAGVERALRYLQAGEP